MKTKKVKFEKMKIENKNLRGSGDEKVEIELIRYQIVSKRRKRRVHVWRKRPNLSVLSILRKDFSESQNRKRLHKDFACID